MFEGRLRFALIVLGVMLIILVARLAQLQIVHADHYRERAKRALILRPKALPFVRGRILDRNGEVLVGDEPCWDLRIDFAVLAAATEAEPIADAADVQSGDATDDRDAMKRMVTRLRRSGRYGNADDLEIERIFRGETANMWREIAARFSSEDSPLTTDDLLDRARDIYARVKRVRRVVEDRRGYDGPVAEERAPHTLVANLDSQEQIAARENFAQYPWVHVVPSSVRRTSGDATPFAHVLGRMGRVDATHIAEDPNADDPFARYRADERRGIAGVEHAAEQRLRGRRGQVRKNRKGEIVPEEFIEAQDGRDAVLTLDAELQRRLYRVLGDTVRTVPDSSGGAIVVLHVPTREVLALVSYPSYDPRDFREHYGTLRDDTDRLPLRFRAVANRYAPGSIVKPLVCLRGLSSGVITLDHYETCTGYLLPDRRDAWRCWQLHGTSMRKAHGSINVVDALRGSCNIFMYRLGERLGVARLCDAFDMVGLGRLSGIGLREESWGINPTPYWLMERRNVAVTPGTARQFAIGQAEVAVTPVQAANLMATYAGGRYRPVTLITPCEPKPEGRGLGSESHWSAIRRGIYQVVNDREGTAYKHARFLHDRYALCGKTGSATANPWPTSYRIPYIDEAGEEQVAIVREGAKRPAIERFKREHPKARFDSKSVEKASVWPPNPPLDGGNHAHAWFAGFLQALDGRGQPDWSVTPQIAFAVLVEFGGSGGRVSGPLGKRVAAEVLEVFGPDLDVQPVFVADEPS